MPIIWIQSFANVDLFRPLEQIVPNDAEIGFTSGNETFRFSLFLSLSSSPRFTSVETESIAANSCTRSRGKRTCVCARKNSSWEKGNFEIRGKRLFQRSSMLIDLMLFKKEKEKEKRKYYRTISNERKRERQSRRVSTNISGATLTLISGFCSPIRTSEGGRERKERGSHARHIGIHAACILRPYSAILHIEHPCPCMRVYIYIRAWIAEQRKREHETEKPRERERKRDPRMRGETKDGKRRERRRGGGTGGWGRWRKRTEKGTRRRCDF